MYIILDTLTRLLAPVLAFTADEIWQYLPHTDKDNAESVMLNDWPETKAEFENEALDQIWSEILGVRDSVLKALDEARNKKLIGQSLQAKVVIKVGGDVLKLLKENLDILPTVFITSQVELAENSNSEVEVEVITADGEKCERCWIYSETVGNNTIIQPYVTVAVLLCKIVTIKEKKIALHDDNFTILILIKTSGRAYL